MTLSFWTANVLHAAAPCTFRTSLTSKSGPTVKFGLASVLCSTAVYTFSKSWLHLLAKCSKNDFFCKSASGHSSAHFLRSAVAQDVYKTIKKHSITCGSYLSHTHTNTRTSFFFLSLSLLTSWHLLFLTSLRRDYLLQLSVNRGFDFQTCFDQLLSTIIYRHRSLSTSNLSSSTINQTWLTVSIDLDEPSWARIQWIYA